MSCKMLHLRHVYKSLPAEDKCFTFFQSINTSNNLNSKVLCNTSLSSFKTSYSWNQNACVVVKTSLESFKSSSKLMIILPKAEYFEILQLPSCSVFHFTFEDRKLCMPHPRSFQVSWAEEQSQHGDLSLFPIPILVGGHNYNSKKNEEL